MATEKLVKTIITGPAERADEAIRRLALDRDFHMISAMDEVDTVSALTALPAENPYRETLDAAIALLGRLGIRLEYRDFSQKERSLESVRAYITAKTGALSRLATRRAAEESLAANDEELIQKLSPVSELSVDIGELLSMRYLSVSFCWAHEDDYPEIAREAAKYEGAYLFRTGQEEEKIYCLLLALPQRSEVTIRRLGEMGMINIGKPDGAGLTGAPTERIPELRREIAGAREKAAAMTRELADMAAAESGELLASYSYLRFMSSGAELRGRCAGKGGSFYMAGWLPESQREQFEADAAGLGAECSFEKPTPGESVRVPVKFSDSFITRIFAPFVRMYGYPAYGELDPRVFMTVTYALLFGIMFGDIGQGACLFILGLVLTKKNSWLGRILCTVSVSSVFFGFVYGSVFGNEHLLPGFKVLEGGNVMTMLIAAVAVGAAMIAACGVMNIITGFRQRDMKKAVFSANGLAGLVLYLGVVAAAASLLILNVNIFGNLFYLIFGVALPLFCLFCAEPLSKLLEGKEDWLPESWGMFFILGFFDIFEACLSWFSNSVSFLRVGAYAICHAGMMMVVYLLSSAGDGGYAIWGLVLGNLLVMGIEAVLVCIQVLRLEYYELFGRFYTGLGTPFAPERVNYSAAA